MYPETLTLAQWRAAAADRARITGADIPAGFDGSDAANARLTPTARQALTIAQNQYILEHTDQFPPRFVASAKAYLNSAAPRADYSQQDAGILSQVVDFGKTIATQTPRDVLKSYGIKTGTEAVKADPKGFGLVVLTGIAIGGAAWYLFGRKAVA